MKLEEDNQRAWNNDLVSISQIDRFGKNYQKRKHLLITSLCNNNCLFCFSKENLKIKNLSLKEIEEKLEEGLLEGCKGVIISGGEATIHPKFIQIIGIAKEKGYKYVEVITNGRMLSYPLFIKKIKKKGIDAITFSIHGHDAKTHDSLTRVKGSYNQAIKAISLATKLKIQIKINIVVNKKNIKHLSKMADIFSEIGVTTIGLLQLVPFGEAWANRKELFYNLNEYEKYIKKFIKKTKEKNITIWSNRFDVKTYLKYPELSQDPSKFINEVEARIFEFENSSLKNKPLFCYPKRCNYCFLKDFCKNFYEINELIHKENIQRRIDPIKFAQFYSKKIVPLSIQGKGYNREKILACKKEFTI